MIYYIRDISGLTGFKYNNNIYYYVKNLQNDIIGILDSNYQEIVKYKYDSWGNILSILDNNGNDISNEQTHIANINPYRYRSYYYDKETDLYYLNSRYYNPKWGRFLNGDTFLFPIDVLSNNLFSYCNNNPIMYIDTTGRWIISGLILIVGLTSIAITASIVVGAKTSKKGEKSKSKNKIGTSKEFKKTLTENLKTAQEDTKYLNFISKAVYFANKVKTYGEWDLKNQKQWEKSEFNYDNLEMEAQDIGNYHYGYIGTALGFGENFLIAAGGIYQIKSRTATLETCLTIGTFCDDPRDTKFIKAGIQGYYKDNIY